MDKILVVDNEDIQRIESHLSNFELVHAPSTSKASQLFDELRPSLVLSEVNSDGIDGYSLLEKIKQNPNTEHIPFVFLSNDSSQSEQARCYRSGGDFYLCKPIQTGQDAFSAILEALINKSKKHLEATKCKLTGMHRRETFFEFLKREVKASNRKYRPITLAILDIDFFKKINDEKGHLEGDRILSEFSSILRAHTRASDFPFRYGGEEFAIIFRSTKEDIVKMVLERFSEVVSDSLGITFSAGIHEIKKYDSPVENSIYLADKALLQAKRSGRNQILIYEDGLL